MTEAWLYEQDIAAKNDEIERLRGLLVEAQKFIAEYPRWAGDIPRRIGHDDLLARIDAALNPPADRAA